MKMGTLKTKGIIIAEKNFSDFDKIVTMLTPNGKIEVSAKGARRPKSQFMAGTQFLCFGDYMLFKGSNVYTLNSCDVVEVFYNIRIDIEKLEYASKITRMILDVTYENQNTYRIMQLYLNTLYVISEMDLDLDFIISVFKIRLMVLLGFTPIVDKCLECGKDDIKYFSFKDNGFKCEECSKQDTGAVSMSEGTRDAIRFIVKAPAKKIFSFDISNESKKELKLIAKIYTDTKLEKEY